MQKAASNSHYDTIIVGSGAGGLGAGVALSKKGQKVLILEQHYVPGGWCHSFQLNGHKFSPGVHYIGGLGEGENYRKVLEGLGVAKDLVFFKMKREGFEHCRIGGIDFDYIDSREEFEKALLQKFPEESAGIKKYLKLLWKTEKQLMRFANAEGGFQKLKAVGSAGTLLRHGWKTLEKILDKYIVNPDLKAILSIQCGDVGLTPDRTNFAFFSAVAGHYSTGGYYPMGGGAAIVKSMTKAIKSNGGEIRTRASVDEILVEDGKVQGVRLANGDVITADRVVSNADAHVTYTKLIDSDNISNKLAKKLSRTTYSPSSIQLFLTVDMDVKKAGIDSGNYWVSTSNDYQKIMRMDSKDHLMAGDKFDAVFIGCSTLKDPTSFNGRYHNFEMVTFVEDSHFEEFVHGQDEFREKRYMELKKKLADKMLNSLEQILPGVKNHVVQMELGTPKTNRFYINATKGNSYGIDKTLKQMGPGAFQTTSEIDGLYLCGSSTVSHGVAGAMNTGLKAASEILGCSVNELLDSEGESLRVFEAELPETWDQDIHDKIETRKRRFKEIPPEEFLNHTDPQAEKIAS